jgi:phosphoglycerate dehydrogenase-like enzyme
VIRIAILDDYQQVALSLADWSSLRPGCEVVSFSSAFVDTADAARQLGDFEIVCAMRERTAFPRALFEALPRLRCLVTTGLRNAAIDLVAAKDCGVVISHTRSGATEFATSELTWALALAAMRKLALEDRRLREGRWQTTLGRTLHGKTLGLVGLGRVGSRVAAVGAAFGMRVIAWSPHLTDERALAAGADRVEQGELFERSDLLSLHMVLAPATRGIVAAAELARMPSHAVLVNTSRAGLVDETALIAALEHERIAAAGLDVFEREPLPANHPFLRMDNVVLTPHLGYVTEETYRIFFEDAVENIAAYVAGAPLRRLEPA